MVVFVSFLFLAACNEHSHDQQSGSSEHLSKDTVLTLNNGKKWKADTLTSRNVVALKTMVNMFGVEPYPSANNYQVLGNDMTNGFNKMIKECKMSGPDHDALHLWMEPIIKESNQLKTITDTIQARQLFKSIKERVDNYPAYFEDDVQ